MKKVVLFEAAHCVDGIAADGISVRIGSSIYDAGGRSIGVQNIFFEDYKPSTVENDIGKKSRSLPCFQFVFQQFWS